MVRAERHGSGPSSRDGWGFVQHTASIELMVYGALPGPIRSSPRAGLYALLKFLEVCTTPVHVYTDYMGILDGSSWGPGYTRGPRRPNADLWSAI
eukprot:7756671-Pyramimonas_sp.AAC.1